MEHGRVLSNNEVVTGRKGYDFIPDYPTISSPAVEDSPSGKVNIPTLCVHEFDPLGSITQRCREHLADQNLSWQSPHNRNPAHLVIQRIFLTWRNHLGLESVPPGSHIGHQVVDISALTRFQWIMFSAPGSRPIHLDLEFPRHLLTFVYYR